jgi:hypothetical protein
MKPKIAVVKYFDLVILGILALVFLYALAAAFMSEDTLARDAKGEMDRLAKTIKKGIAISEVVAPEPPDNLERLIQRYERIDVKSRLVRNPFVDPTFPGPTFEVAIGQKLKFEVKHEIVGNSKFNTSIMKLEYKFDAATGTTTIIVSGLEVGSEELRLDTSDERIMQCSVVIRKTSTLPPPKNPFSAIIVARKPTEEKVDDKTWKRKGAKVILVIEPDNLIDRLDRDKNSVTRRFRVYRKAEGAPDTEYIPLTDKPIKPLTQEQAQPLRIEFLAATVLAAEEGRRTPRDDRTPVDGDVPRGADEIPETRTRRTAGPTRDREAEVATATKEGTLESLLNAGNYVYIDHDVFEGESYVYKLVSVAWALNSKPVECLNPYVGTAEIPALVEFAFQTAVSTGATFIATRPSPEKDSATGQSKEQLTQTLRGVAPGLSIGGIIPMRMKKQLAEGRILRYNIDVDFSTDCVLVAPIPRMREWKYKVGYKRRSDALIYSTRRGFGKRVIYLTPSGHLKMKAIGEVEDDRKVDEPEGGEEAEGEPPRD